MATIHLTREAVRRIQAIAPNTGGAATDVVAVLTVDASVALSETQGEGALATLDTVDTDQIEDGAVTAAKIGDAELASIGGLTSAADKGIYFTGSGTAAVYDLNASGRALGGVSGAANKVPYFTGAGTAALADFSASGRAVVNLTGAADKGVYFTGDGTAATYDLNASGRALGGVSGAADKVPYFTGAGTAALADFTAAARTLAALSGVVGIQVASETALTDAEIKALPTTPKAIAAPAAPTEGFVAVPIAAWVKVNATAGAYTNVDPGVATQVATTTGIVALRSEVAAVFTGASSNAQVLIPSDGFGGTLANIENRAYQIQVDNAAAGNLTGGNAANTGSVKLVWLLMAI